MIHFITLTKSRALALAPGGESNRAIAQGLDHELMKMGYVFGKAAFEVVSTQPLAELAAIHAQLIGGMREIVGDDGYEPIYRDFPEGVIARGEGKGVQAAIDAYRESGVWDEAGGQAVQREFSHEPDSFKAIGIMSPDAVDSIYTDLLAARQPLSPFDKLCVRHFFGTVSFEHRRIGFQETAAFVGSLMLDDPELEAFPARHATDVLRTYCAYCGGDEGLKESTRFNNPSRRLRGLMMRALEACDPSDLEESFKSYREPWLRLLFTLHPTSPKNTKRYPVLAGYAQRLRNDPKSLLTFDGKVELAIKNADPEVLDLLKTRPGAFMRRLDHMVRIFGAPAFRAWMECKPGFAQLLNIYNHFYDRAGEQKGRAAVLAGQGASEVVTYDAHAALSKEVVDEITTVALERLRSYVSAELTGKVFIDPALYLRPLAVNNRASSFALDAKPVGTVERYEAQQTLRMYVHWEGPSDIDLSGFAITKDLEVIKVGWNAQHAAAQYMAYSGDNTGRNAKNAEYLDLNTEVMPANLEWLVIEARIYRGPDTYAGYEGKVRAGWMSRESPNANVEWLPETLEHSMVLQSASRTAYLMAYHPRTQSIVYLDVAMGASNVSGPEDALKMVRYLDATVALPGAGGPEVTWDNLRTGHILELLSGEVVSSPELADVAFDETTTSERVGALMKSARTS